MNVLYRQALFQSHHLSYHTTASYSSFPSHISRYPEQKISSPDHSNRMFSERFVKVLHVYSADKSFHSLSTIVFICLLLQLFSESDRHCEHMDKVRLYHQSLQEQTAAHSVCSSSASDINPSSSILFSALRYDFSDRPQTCFVLFSKEKAMTTTLCFYRKKLSELDNIQKYFSRKLSTPTFPATSEQDFPNKCEQEQRDTDACQLLLKSNQLVGEVNSIISGKVLTNTEDNPLNGSQSRNIHDLII